MDFTEIAIEDNFWEVNPHVRYLTKFKDLYEKDKSKDKTKSSRQMWAVVLFVDTRSPFRRMEETQRKIEVLNYLGNSSTWEEIEPYFKPYEEACLSEKQQLFKSWGDKLRTREQFIRATDYKATTFKMLDEMMSQTEKMWKMYANVEKDMIEEEQQARIKGGRKRSKSERKEI